MLQNFFFQNQTSGEFIDVELDTYYQVSLAAYSIKGSSPEATVYRFVNSTAALITSESWMSTEIILLIVAPIVIIGIILMLVFNHFLVKKQQKNYFKVFIKTVTASNSNTSVSRKLKKKIYQL